MDFDRAALMGEFFKESGDLMDAAEAGMIALEVNPGDSDTVNSVFRSIHTIKGNASSLELTELTEFTHVLEELLDGLRKGMRSVGKEVIDLGLSMFDVVRRLLAEAAEGHGALLERDRALMKAAVDGGMAPLPAELHTDAAAFSDFHAKQGLRIDVEKLDRLLDLAGEITVSRSRLGQRLETAEHDTGFPLLEAHREADRLYMELQEQVMRLRMVPIGPALRKYARTVRDLAAATGKLARLHITGDDVELDMRVLSELKDPFTHMLRNALDHGLEAPAERTRAGKDPCGTISIAVSREAGSIIIRLSDDGAGLDSERIVAQALAMRLIDIAPNDRAAIFDLIFEAGFSTTESVTRLSGRGVGLDVVRRNIEQMHGSILIDSEPGLGTAFTIRLPLTMAVIHGFNVGVGDETYVIPLESIVECRELGADVPGAESAAGVMHVRSQPVPFIRLRHLFNLPAAAAQRESVVVVQSASGLAGLVVDRLIGENQTVIKPLGKVFQGLRAIAGSSFLGNGRVALIIDIAEVFVAAREMAAVR